MNAACAPPGRVARQLHVNAPRSPALGMPQAVRWAGQCFLARETRTNSLLAANKIPTHQRLTKTWALLSILFCARSRASHDRRGVRGQSPRVPTRSVGMGPPIAVSQAAALAMYATGITADNARVVATTLIAAGAASAALTCCSRLCAAPPRRKPRRAARADQVCFAPHLSVCLQPQLIQPALR